MSSVILLVFEGEDTERRIFASLEKHFFGDTGSQCIKTYFRGEIYQLWNILKDDPDLDLLEVLRERDKNDPILKDLIRKEVGQIFLFFDYDRHSHPEVKEYDKDVISPMLELFDEETGPGKLYISYPMVEALKHARRDVNECFNCVTLLNRMGDYKDRVSRESDFNDIKKLTRDDWLYLMQLHLLRGCCLVHDRFEPVDYKDLQKLTQPALFYRQVEKFIDKGKVASLSAFPFFLMEYFGKDRVDEAFQNGFSKNCSFSCLAE